MKINEMGIGNGGLNVDHGINVSQIVCIELIFIHSPPELFQPQMGQFT